jgi:hypothetical protein
MGGKALSPAPRLNRFNDGEASALSDNSSFGGHRGSCRPRPLLEAIAQLGPNVTRNTNFSRVVV